MPESNKLEKNLEEIEIELPFEVLKDYCKKVDKKQKLSWLGVAFIVLLSAGLAVAAILVGVIVWGAIGLAILAGMASLLAGAGAVQLSFLNVREHISFSFHDEYIDFKYKNKNHNKILKRQKNGKDYTIFSTASAAKDIIGAMREDYFIPKEARLGRELESLNKKLEDYTKKSDPSETHLIHLNAKKEALQKQLDYLKKNIKLSEAALDIAHTRFAMQCESDDSLRWLSYFLSESKKIFKLKNLEKINSNSNDSIKNEAFRIKLDSLKRDLAMILLGLKQAKKRFQEKGKSPEEIENINQHIKNIDHRVLAIICPFFEKELDEVANPQEAAYWTMKGLYFEYFPKEATEYYSVLLITPALRQNTLELLNHILITHPEKESLVNQTVHFILANHFFCEIPRTSNPKALEIIKHQACLHALQLDSNNPENANLKSSIIAAVFYSEIDDWTAEIQNLLKISHRDSNMTFEAIQKLVLTEKEEVSSKEVLQFSPKPPEAFVKHQLNEPNIIPKKNKPSDS